MVIDASAAIEVVTGTRAGHDVLDAIDGQQLDAPEMIYLETLHGCRGLLRGGRISTVIASGIVRELADLGLTCHTHVPFAPRIWDLRDRCTAYDASYVALAEHLKVPMITMDRRLHRAVGDLLPVVLIDG